METFHYKSNIMKHLKYIIAPAFLTLFYAMSLKDDLPVLDIGAPAPQAEVKMKDVSGKEYSIQDLNQKNGVLVVFSCQLSVFSYQSTVPTGATGCWPASVLR